MLVTVISADTVADLLGVHVQTVYTAAREGQIPCRRVGRRFVFVREVVERWLCESNHNASAGAGAGKG